MSIQASLGQNSGFQPQKRLGQHFLFKKSVLHKIVQAAKLNKNDWVWEIGPGQGSLTLELAKAAGKVLAIEKDYRLIPVLQDRLKGFKNINIVQGDARKIKPPQKPYKVVANLPYYVATHLVRCFLEAKRPPTTMVLLVQKEVGQRICSQPPRMNLLAVAVQFYAQAEIIGRVPKAAFWPKPKVDGAVIRLKAKKKTQADKKLFFKIVRAGFSQPRKQLLNNLSQGLKLPKGKTKNWVCQNNINPEKRPQTISLNNWLKLTETFASLFPACAIIKKQASTN